MNFQKRIARLRALAEAEELDAIMITNASDVFYFSGFDGGESALVISADGLVLVTDSRFTIQASEQAALYEVRIYPAGMGAELKKAMKDMKIRRLGFQASNLTYELFEEYRKLFKLNEMKPVDKAMTGFRAIKDADEIAVLRRAVKIADDAFEHIKGFIKPGMTELEISAELEYFMIKNGASGNSFPLIVAAGERSAMPHAAPTDRKAVAGESIKMDFGCTFENYKSDITRMVFLGEPSRKMRKIYDTVLRSELLALKVARAGVNVKDLDLTARAYIDDKGFSGKFLHGLGHGVGIDIHEYPHVSYKQDVVLEENMVITIEPGIYIEGFGGVRIEDMVVIKNKGCELLTGAPKELTVIGM